MQTTASSRIISLKCEGMAGLSKYISEFKLLVFYMGTGEAKLTEHMGVQLLRRATENIEEIKAIWAVIDTTDAVRFDP